MVCLRGFGEGMPADCKRGIKIEKADGRSNKTIRRQKNTAGKKYHPIGEMPFETRQLLAALKKSPYPPFGFLPITALS
jgi:hypothetical protein